MSDRHEQAGAHAEARTQTWTTPHSDYADGYVSGHLAGVEWADANPQPVPEGRAMSDRTEQAQAEAERQFPDGTWIAREQDRIIFTKGWHAADANHPAVEALARVRELHRPVHPVFNWQAGLRYEEPCATCWGKAGVHECGCWSDEDTEYECWGCAAPREGKRRSPALWPCATYQATEVDG